jgi:hypothetical protein
VSSATRVHRLGAHDHHEWSAWWPAVTAQLLLATRGHTLLRALTLHVQPPVCVQLQRRLLPMVARRSLFYVGP